jgi:hypothetical protein
MMFVGCFFWYKNAEEKLMNDSLCANHISIPAVFTCSRCGTFGCGQCQAVSSDESNLCLACQSRVNNLVDGNVKADELFTDSLRLVKDFLPHIISLAAIASALQLVPMLLQMFVPLPFISVITTILGAVISLTLLGAWNNLLISKAQGVPMSPAQALKEALPSTPSLFVANLFLGLAVGLGLVLLVAPGIIAAAGLCLTSVCVMHKGTGPFEALQESWELTNGKRMPIFLALLGALLLTLFASIPISIVLIPVRLIFSAILPVTVASIIVGALQAFATTVISAPLFTVPVLAYLRLRRGDFA